MKRKSFLSIAAFYDGYLRRCFTSSGLTSQTINIDSQTTIQLWAPNHANQEKPFLLFLHGFGPTAIWQWRKQVQFFAPMFNVYVPDLLFFGGSKTTSSERSEVFQAECVGKLMEKLGVEKYDVMGTSYGGFVAYRMAQTFPERIGNVVIASSGVNMKREDNKALLERAALENVENLMLPENAAQLRKLIGLAVNKKPLLPSFMIPDFFLNDFVHNMYSDNRKEKMELLEGITLGRDGKEDISPLKHEVLLVWGDQDHIFPVEMAGELKKILGHKAKLEIIKNTSHVPQTENPGQFNNIVKSFLCGSS